MSRSYKKPFVPVVGRQAAGAMKKWKQQVNRALRRELVDLESSWDKAYNKHTDNWGSPNDGGRLFWDTPKNRRK